MTNEAVDIRQTDEWAHYMERIGWQALRVGPGWGYAQTFPLIGPILKLPRLRLPIPWNELEKVIVSLKPWLIMLEPYLIDTHPHFPQISERIHRECAMYGFSPSRHASIFPKTLSIDIRQPTDVLWKGVRPSTKTKIKKALYLDTEIVLSDEIDLFVDLWANAAKHRLYFFPQKKHIEALWCSFNNSKKAQILLATVPLNRQYHIQRAYHQEELPSCTYVSIHKYIKNNKRVIVGGILLACGKQNTHYLYAFTTQLGKTLPSGSLLAWEAIRWAKKGGYAIFDFEGLHEPHFTPASWKGFSFFKKGFGGRDVRFVGAFQKTARWAHLLPIRFFF